MNWPYRRFKIAALFAFLSFYLYTLATAFRGEDAALIWLLFGSRSLVILFLPRRALSVARGLALGQTLVFGIITGFSVFLGVAGWLASGANGLMLAETAVVLIAQDGAFLCRSPRAAGTQRTAWVAFPRELSEMLSSDWPCKPHRDIEGDHLIPHNSYTVYYKLPSEAKPGDPSTFSLQARPNLYRESGVRSYYVDEDGIIRGTVKNRPATKNDSPVPICEWDVGTTCRSD